MHINQDAQIFIDYLEKMARREWRFGPSQALLRFGRSMIGSCDIPTWMSAGTKKQCYGNAVTALFAAIGRRRNDIQYAEGYAIAKDGFPFPIQHAWLVDGEGKILDPTWTDHAEHDYFGVEFDTSFVLRMLEETDLTPGLLVDGTLIRKHFASPAQFAAALATRTVRRPVDQLPSLTL
jgi:hypothetical protein